MEQRVLAVRDATAQIATWFAVTGFAGGMAYVLIQLVYWAVEQATG